MKISRDEALKAVDDIFNYCEEIDNSLPENERSGYKMLPDIHKIRKYIIENERPHGEWNVRHDTMYHFECPFCKYLHQYKDNFCPLCGADMRVKDELNSEIEKSKSEKTCLNCGTSEQECELGNRAKHGFCGNWTERR